jgi:hypothetical protein
MAVAGSYAVVLHYLKAKPTARPPGCAS